jgi:molecular chaperone GrpE
MSDNGHETNEEGAAKGDDGRKFTGDGEPRDLGGESATQLVQDPASPIILKLEEELRLERERREAAEAKLVGVQAKFDEMRIELEKESAEFRQRIQKNNEQRITQERAEFLASMLPILDNLNLAVQAAEDDQGSQSLLVGIKGTARLFEQSLMSVGVEPIVAFGNDFDPELHEAIEIVECEAEEDGKIVGEFSRGYKMGDKLLRASKVQVGKAS